MNDKKLMLNYINNEWRRSGAVETLEVLNPASAEVLTRVPLSPAAEVDQAAQAAAAAFHHRDQVFI